MKKILVVSALFSIGAMAISQNAYAGPTLDAVKARGTVICAANGSRMGFSSLDSKGEWQGQDVDSCRAVAAAVLGDASKTQFLKTTTQTRFTVLQTGEVDIMAANATWTLSRDTKLAADFVTPTFYDGQGFMVNKRIGVTQVKDLNGATLCVSPGSTSQKVAAVVDRIYNIKFTTVVIENQKEINTAFFSGRCDVHIQTTSGLSANRAAAAANPEDFIILPGLYGKDPMGPVVRQGDAQWRDIVNWSIFAMIAAEEAGVTSKNVDDMLKNDDPEIQRLLGAKDNLGEALGLDKDWAYRIIKQVGNYGEVFDRNCGKDSPLKLARGVNDLWTKGGMMFSPPFK